MSTTTWPTADDLIAWVPDGTELTLTEEEIQGLVDDATDWVRERIDEDKLPDTADECPRTIRRAILLWAAHLYTRRDSANGAIAFGEFAIRVGTDTDVDKLLDPKWTVDAEP